jgi:hypothetical protein
VLETIIREMQSITAILSVFDGFEISCIRHGINDTNPAFLMHTERVAVADDI